MGITRILIIASPGANLDSLYAVLPALIDDVEVHNSSSYTDTELMVFEHEPDLVLIDNDIGYQESRQICELLTSQFPRVKIVILSDASHWQKWKIIGQSHQVLLKGFSTRRLKATLSKSLSKTDEVEVTRSDLEV